MHRNKKVVVHLLEISVRNISAFWRFYCFEFHRTEGHVLSYTDETHAG